MIDGSIPERVWGEMVALSGAFMSSFLVGGLVVSGSGGRLLSEGACAARNLARFGGPSLRQPACVFAMLSLILSPKT